jgi:hypothetical protein
MPLNKDVLGVALKARADDWNNKTPAEIGDMEAARLAFWKALADEVIQHFRTAGVVSVNVTTTGTALAHTGTGTGTIN